MRNCSKVGILRIIRYDFKVLFSLLIIPLSFNNIQKNALLIVHNSKKVYLCKNFILYGIVNQKF